MTPRSRGPDPMDELARVIADLGDPDTAARFLRELLTPTEMHAITRRWLICRYLLAGLPQREIAARLHVSLCNITRGAREVKRADSLIRRYIAQIDPDNVLLAGRDASPALPSSARHKGHRQP